MQLDSWTLLSDATRRAVSLGWAAAQVRNSQAENNAGDPAQLKSQNIVNFTPPSEVQCPDLLVGLSIVSPPDSDLRKFFSFYGLVPGQALPEGYPNLTSDGLNRFLDDGSEPPQMCAEVEDILRRTVEAGPHVGPDELRHCWAYLLDQSKEMQDFLARYEIPTGVVTATVSWVSSKLPDPYEGVLNQFAPSPIQMVNFKADTRSELHGDLVGISDQVDAFAYLLASHTLEPPLAVGLFGDWGSGKTFFMDAIQARINALTMQIQNRPQRETPFWKRIAQVRFNAWHYVEGDLWSSLAFEIFSQLELASDKKDSNIVARRQQYLLSQIKARKEDLRELSARRRRLDSELASRAAEVDRTLAQRERAVEALSSTLAEQVSDALLADGRDAVLEAIRSVNLKPPRGQLTIGQAVDALQAARAQAMRGRALMTPLFGKPTELAKLVVAVAAVPLIVWGIDTLANSAAFAATGGISSLGLILVGALKAATDWADAGLRKIESAQEAVDSARQKQEQDWNERVKCARQEVEEATGALKAVEEAEKKARDELDAVEKRLAAKPSEVLSEFLNERVKAGDYRDKLGVPSLIRRDFQSLAELLLEQNRWLLSPDSTRESMKRDRRTHTPPNENDDAKIINRIILYIDDLDRCPDENVIEVLQAVHLLLAFPLFVVVVAVDSRWLAHALRTRYPALAGVRTYTGSAQPEDYLEKIFQIPFWVKPLADEDRRKIVHGLLGAHVQAVTQEPPLVPVDGTRAISAEESRLIRENLDSRLAPPQLAAAALTVTQEEIEFLDGLAPLMGETPRSVKRLINVYQLLKISLRRRQGQVISSAVPSDQQVLAFILALAEGASDLTDVLIRASAQSSGMLLSTFVASGPGVTRHRVARQRLSDWLEPRPEWGALPLGRIGGLAEDASQFLFRSRG